MWCIWITTIGTEYRTQIEYAPYQRIPRLKKPKDPRQGKYENGISHITHLSDCFAEKQLEVREAKDKAASGDEKKISPFLEFFDSARGM
jgi:hypothetical protein